MLNAQWTSPGNGTTFNLDALVETATDRRPLARSRRHGHLLSFVSDVIIITISSTH